MKDKAAWWLQGDPSCYSECGIYFIALQEKCENEKNESAESRSNRPDLTGTEWGLIRAHAHNDELDTSADFPSEQHQVVTDLCKKIDSFAEDLKVKLQLNDYQLISGVEKFVTRYSKLASQASLASLASAFQQFGWLGGGVVQHTKGGFIGHG